MKEKLIERLYSFWRTTNKEENKSMLEYLKDTIYNKGVQGAEELLDWCRDDYETYYEENNITQEEIEERFGDIPCGELDNIWDICNWYLDYCHNQMTEKELLELIGED